MVTKVFHEHTVYKVKNVNLGILKVLPMLPNRDAKEQELYLSQKLET